LRFKVFGAGSIGNHLSHAARTLSWHVDICDVDEDALERTQNSIYPERYGAWDESIGLYHSDEAPSGGYDIIAIGTPPDVHLPIALEAIDERPKAILIEKPICGPDLAHLSEFSEAAKTAGIKVFVGYDHVVGEASEKVTDLINAQAGQTAVTIDVEFREHWGGIFGAHPWLDGPHDSYLGFYKRGGGASGEHSHAINLWQHFAHSVGAGRITEISAQMDFVRDDKVDYDRICLMQVVTESGLIGRIVQDVVTNPPRKWARIQMEDGFIEWQCGIKPGFDAVTSAFSGADADQLMIEKTRPDDFIRELKHIQEHLDSEQPSPISLQRGADTMAVVKAAHESATNKATVKVDY